jgi:hypothetical protein
MIALKQQTTPRVVIALPPVYQPRVGEQVKFSLFLFGEERQLVGLVQENAIPNTALLIYEYKLPPKHTLAPIYKKSFPYPKDGIFRGEVQVPLEQVSPYDGDQLELPTKKPTQAQQRAQRKAERARKEADKVAQAEAIAKATRSAELRTDQMLAEAAQAEDLHTRLSLLEQERDCIKSEGAMGLKGAWIECNKVHEKDFIQAVWNARKPIFRSTKGGLTKSQYIGKEGSLKHQQAGAQWSRRQRYETVCAQIEVLSEGI